MPIPAREVKDLFFGEAARNKVRQGTTQMYEAVSAVYGPGAGNALLGLPYGDPTVTRDGVTVAKRVRLRDHAEDDAAQVLRQASDKTNKTAGDGTTATIVLAHHIFQAADRQVAAGENPMLLKRELDQDSRVVTEFVTSKSVEASKHLVEVATVSSGDKNIGKLIASTLEDIGAEGGITIREQSYPIVDVEKVNGYYFDRGFFALNQQIEYEKPLILVSQKRLASNADVLPLLNIVVNGDNRKLVIIGDIAGDALNTTLANVVNGKLDAVIIPPPAYNDEATLFMEDIATYVGAKVFLPSDNPNHITMEHFGSAERVQVSQDRAILFGGMGNGDDITTRASQIKQNANQETNAHAKDQLESRYSKLVGKIAIVNVGASTPAEMEELRYRVEDAIEAVKSAMADGVVPGGAIMLVHAAQLEISPLFSRALKATFNKLMENAAEPGDFRFEQIKRAEFGCGFNLRAMTEEPIDLAKAGIWDATRAVVQTVENAVSAAGTLLTIGSIVSEADEVAPLPD